MRGRPPFSSFSTKVGLGRKRTYLELWHALLMTKALTLRSRTRLPPWKPHHDSRQVDDQPAVVVEQLERSEDNQVPARASKGASTLLVTRLETYLQGVVGIVCRLRCEFGRECSRRPSTARPRHLDGRTHTLSESAAVKIRSSADERLARTLVSEIGPLCE